MHAARMYSVIAPSWNALCANCLAMVFHQHFWFQVVVSCHEEALSTAVSVTRSSDDCNITTTDSLCLLVCVKPNPRMCVLRVCGTLICDYILE